MKKILIHITLLILPILLWSQQDAQYTQYMYNMSSVNPAYTTGTADIINFGGIYRSQWVGVIGAPKTANIFIHKPINENIEVGLTFINDNIGDIVKENNIYADFAYKIELNDFSSLSFGLKVGGSFYNVDFSNFNLESQDVIDPSFAENLKSSYFNFGSGLYYNTEKLYVGLSVPTILNAKHLNNTDGRYQSVQQAHFYLTAGYVIDINEAFKLKPAFMAKAAKGTPVEFDVTANILYNNRFEFGVAYRFNDAVSGIVNIGVTENLRIGYAYDYTTSNLGSFSSGSHEFLLLYNLGKLNFTKGFDKSPRFF